MLKVALTGGIATGKTHVLEDFRRLGAACLSADELAHGVMAAGTEATQEIARRFGDHVLDRDGAVDRTKLGPIVFADAAARRDLEAIVHPAVRRSIEVALRTLERSGEVPMTVVEIPLLYETGRPELFDRVVATVAAPASQIARLRARGLTEDQATQRLAAQMPADEKARRADFVVDTDGSFEDTRRQVEVIWNSLF